MERALLTPLGELPRGLFAKHPRQKRSAPLSAVSELRFMASVQYACFSPSSARLIALAVVDHPYCFG